MSDSTTNTLRDFIVGTLTGIAISGAVSSLSPTPTPKAGPPLQNVPSSCVEVQPGVMSCPSGALELPPNMRPVEVVEPRPPPLTGSAREAAVAAVRAAALAREAAEADAGAP